jgi:hypothetical protein
MDHCVTVEYRGIVGTLAVGSSVVVESCDAGVLRLRVPGTEAVTPAEKVVPDALEKPTTQAPTTEGSADA